VYVYFEDNPEWRLTLGVVGN